jgi:crotonobetainyl-CoA:carnitine CoA-transferase CaiB-like acyl-CoA transferase
VSALAGFRVVEIAETVAGEYCGKLLADFGAEIIKVERPGGSPTRAMAPIVGSGPEASGLFAYLNTNKKSVVLDVGSEEGVETLHKLISAGHVLIDDHDEDWLSKVGLTPDAVERAHPSTVFCSITPYGQGAPADMRTAKSVNVFHGSGWGYHTPSSPDLGRPPLKGAGRFLSDYEAALDAALCIVSSLIWRAQSGKGQFIDIAEVAVLVSRTDLVLGRMLAGEVPASNERTAYDMAGPAATFACADGFVYMMVLNRNHWRGLRALLGDPEWMNAFDQDWLEFGVTDEKVAEFRTRFAEWVRPFGKDEVSAKAQQVGVPLVPVNDASDLHRSEQFAFRQFFQRLAHPVLGEALYPTVPYKLSASPATLTRPAPMLGEHQDAAFD